MVDSFITREFQDRNTKYVAAMPQWMKGSPTNTRPVNTLELKAPGTQSCPTIRQFESGATRNADTEKLDYEGFFSPLVMKRYAEYMHKNRFLEDGSMRGSDNWQKGIPLDSYMKSGYRHFVDVWQNHRGIDSGVTQEEALCAVLFNMSGYLHTLLEKKK